MSEVKHKKDCGCVKCTCGKPKTLKDMLERLKEDKKPDNREQV